jgi:hypothetical protein
VENPQICWAISPMRPVCIRLDGSGRFFHGAFYSVRKKTNIAQHVCGIQK